MTSSETTFNDEELLIWLRVEDTNLTDFAADRIEELLNLNEALVELMDDRDAKLEKAVERLTNLEKSASEVSRYGAATGPQWTKMSIAILAARATLVEIKGESHE